MTDIIKLAFFQRALLSSLLSGITCSVIGVWVIMMKISFIGVCLSHAAFAGALLGLLLHNTTLFFPFLFSFAAAGILGPLSDRAQLSHDTSIGIIFATTLGLAFLFMGILPEAKSGALNLLWGSILTINSSDIILLLISTFLVLLTLIFFWKEIQSLIFHRELAKSVGISSTVFLYLILFLSGMAITTSLKSVGGLLVFSLVINPAASAYQITYSLKKMYILAIIFGVVSCWAGLFISSIFNVPTGASIVLVTSFIFLLSNIFSPKRKNGKKEKVFQ